MKIAITGTMGAGKSSVTDYLKSLGYEVLDTDKMVHDYYLEDGKLYTQIIALLGDEILEGTQIDRRKVANIVFNDKNKLKQLESIVHPVVSIDILAIQDSKDLRFIEVPQLFESNMDAIFDKTIMVDADEANRIDRLIKRGMDSLDIKERFKHQMSAQEKRDRSDIIIDNNDSIELLHKTIDELVQRLKEENDE